MMTGKLHDSEYLEYEIKGNVLMENVTHGVYEDRHGARPSQWFINLVFVSCDPEAVDVVGRSHRLQASCHAFGIAVLATGTDFGAAS